MCDPDLFADSLENLMNDFLGVSLSQDYDSHFPDECKHCNTDGIHCTIKREFIGRDKWFKCQVLTCSCLDFTPKANEKVYNQ